MGFHSGHRFASGRWVVAELAVVLVAAGAASRSVPVLGASVLLAAPLLVLSLGRLRGRPLASWLGLALGYAARRRALATQPPGGPLLTALDPAARLALAEGPTGPVGVVRDSAGLVAVLDVGDSAALLADPAPSLPTPAELLAAGTDGRDLGGAGLTVQVLLQSRPAPAPGRGAGLPGSSYRQLTGGTVPAALRVLVAVRVTADPGATVAELTPVLLGAVRRVGARLARDGATSRGLSPEALVGALTELAPYAASPGDPVGVAAPDRANPPPNGGTGAPVPNGAPGDRLREGWSGLRLGQRHQAVYRPRRWPALAAELLPRLLALPAGEVTVALRAERGDSGSRAATGYGRLTVRLSAPDATGLAMAQRDLHRLFAMAGGSAVRLDGAQLPGLLATLPLAPSTAPPGAIPLAGQHQGPPDQATTGAGGEGATEPERLLLPTAGLMMGRNRHGQPVTVRLLRAEPTRAVLVGGGRAAATVVLRALALGAHVVVQTGRPESWDQLLRGVVGPADAVALAPPGAPFSLPPASAAQPQLVVLDVGPTSAVDPVPPGRWRSTLVVRDDVSTVDLAALSRADLVVLQPLRPAEAELVGVALGLGDGHAWLTRIREDMVGVVSRRTVRWAQLSATSLEQQVIGGVARVLAG